MFTLARKERASGRLIKHAGARIAKRPSVPARTVDELPARWFAAMRRADFAAAWEVSDRILAARAPGEHCWHLPRHEQWVWDGRPLANRRVLVRCYHGLGDTIQFARFLPWLDGVAATTTVWAQPALIDLLKTLPGERELRPLHEGTPEVEYEVDIEIMELAHAFRVDPRCLADTMPYFHVPPAPRPSQKVCVGLVASTGDWDVRRSVPPDLLAGLRHIPDTECFNLQLDQPLEGIRDLSTPNLVELATRIRAVDLIITPDTMLAHLAGALAIPVWTLLPFDSDWRWLQPDRTDTPWYPSMRLFHQPRPGDWGTVIGRIEAELSAALSSNVR